MYKNTYLKPFKPSQYSLLISWIPNENFALTWGGPRYTWPITEQQIHNYLTTEPIHPLMYYQGNQPIGYIELAEKPHNEITLCRILIANNANRGQGLGQQLIEQAIDKAKNELNAKSVELSVFDDNIPAFNCYKSFGFKTYLQITDIIEGGQVRPLRRMRLWLD